MGIRFRCVHCEKRLNVKSTQAGQEGNCTHCGNTVLVPYKSTIPSSLKKASQSGRRQLAHAGTDRNTGLLERADATIEQPLNHATDDDAFPASKLAAAQELSDSSSTSFSNSFELGKPGPPETLGKVDPIAEAPKRVWYFRSREIGEKGPLRGKIMREHVDQGDVRVGSVVWREDWKDWLPAEKVFPALVEQAKQMRQQDRVDRAFRDANYKIPDEFNPHSELNRKRRFRHQLFLAAIATGVLVIGLLIFVLIKLLTA